MKLSKIFRIKGRTVINQQPSALTPDGKPSLYLPHLLRLTTCIEDFTGHAWHITSYVRDSPSHKTSCALDIAPKINPSSEHAYAVNNNSDPVLYKRVPLIRALQALARTIDPSPYSVGIFIEPDHLHLQLFEAESAPVIRVFKWKIPKPVYPDTFSRMDLPMTDVCYAD